MSLRRKELEAELSSLYDDMGTVKKANSDYDERVRKSEHELAATAEREAWKDHLLSKADSEMLELKQEKAAAEDSLRNFVSVQSDVQELYNAVTMLKNDNQALAHQLAEHLSREQALEVQLAERDDDLARLAGTVDLKTREVTRLKQSGRVDTMERARQLEELTVLKENVAGILRDRHEPVRGGMDEMGTSPYRR